MRRLVLLALVSLSVACAGERNLKITEDNKGRVLEEIKDSRSFSVEEVRLILARQMRVSLAESMKQPSPPWVGQTLQQIIDDERKLEQDAKAKQAESERLAAEAKAKEDALAEELRKAITLVVFDKGFIPSDIYNSRYEDYITVKCAYENRAGKDVRAFTGGVRFADLFEKEITTISLTIDDPIKAGEKATWNGTIKYNQFVDSHQTLRNAELKNLRITWIPKSIIFADGTQIGEK